MDWWLWRLLTPHNGRAAYASMGDLDSVWSFEDTLIAHEILDALDSAAPQ